MKDENETENAMSASTIPGKTKTRMKHESRPTNRKTISHQRRGSILILVVGVLVLLAISATLYVGVGQQERLSASAEKSQTSQEEIINKIVEFIGQTLADDLYAAPLDPSNSAKKLPPVRPFEDGVELSNGNQYPSSFRTGERWDYPLTRPTTRPGTIDKTFNLLADPWLASTEPDDLKQNAGGGGGTLDGIPDTWRHLSNINPNGTFIDLKKLVDRNTVKQFSIYGNVTIGGNNPPPPFDLDTLVVNGVLNTRGEGSKSFDYSVQMDDVANLLLLQDDGVVGAPTYHDQEFGTDTDGDGRMDARWTELPGVYGFPLGMRVFTAVRIVDLSAMVNVNTSIETGPTQNDDDRETVGFPRDPSDIDLYTMLLDEYGRLGGTFERNFAGGLPPTSVGAFSEHLRSMGVLGYAFDYLQNPSALDYNLGTRLRAADRSAMYNDFLGGSQEAAFDDFKPYGPADELELRTYWGMSNDLVTSRLEEHFDVLNGNNLPGHTPWLSPFKNRVPYEVDYTKNSPTFAENIAVTGIRNKVTTINGSRSVSSWNVSERDTSIHLKDNINDLLTPIGQDTDVDLQQVFSGIAWALMPYAVNHDKDLNGDYLTTNIYGKPTEWKTTQSGDIRNYGGVDTADFAYLRSAMLAVNLLDYFDPDKDENGLPIDDDPTIRVLRFEQQTIANANNINGRDSSTELAGVFPWGEIPDDGVNQSPGEKNMMLIGLEKQPFFREVAHVQLWNGVFDGTSWTVDSLSNPEELVSELFAFELGNPWDEDIDLSQYEIAVGGKVNVGEIVDLSVLTDPILRAGQSVVIVRAANDGLFGAVTPEDVWRDVIDGRGGGNQPTEIIPGGFLRPTMVDDNVTLWRKDITLKHDQGTPVTIERVLVDRIAADQTGNGDENTFPGTLASVRTFTPNLGDNPGLQVMFNSSMRRNVKRVADDTGNDNGFPPYIMQSPSAIGINGIPIPKITEYTQEGPRPISNFYSSHSVDLIDQLNIPDTDDKGYPAGFVDLFYAPFQMHILNNQDIASPFDLLDVCSVTHVYIPLIGLGFDPLNGEPANFDNRDRYITISEMLGDEELFTTIQNRIQGFSLNQMNVLRPTGLSQNLTAPDCRVLLPNSSPVPNHFVGKIDYTRDIPNGSSTQDVPQAVPLAARLVDAFDTITPKDPDGLVEGRININTASLSVLQALPFLNPRFKAGDIPARSTNLRYAKAVQAYRDRAAIRNPIGIDWRNRALAANLADTDNLNRLREDITGTTSRPASAGFTSLGELALISKWSGVGSNGTGPLSHRPPAYDPNTYDSSRSQVLTATGQTGTSYDYKPLDPDPNATAFWKTLGPPTNDPADDVTEWMIIPRAISDVITLRSDVFVAYIKVIGFTPADVDEAIQKKQDGTVNNELDALQPTFAQRYIAVFDRSNVKQPGDRPRLLFAVQAVPTR